MTKFVLICLLFSLVLVGCFAFSQLRPKKSSVLSSQVATPTATIGLVGDLGLGRYITTTARAKNDFSWSFKLVSPWLLANDFTLANLESPIVDNCPPGPTGTFTFCGDANFLPYLQNNKFIFSLANNHILNYGPDGLSQTQKFLTANDIIYSYSPEATSEFAQKSVNGITFGFLSFDLVSVIPSPPGRTEESRLISLIKKYDPSVNWLIVSLHWGTEYKPQPSPWQVTLAHQLVAAGADIIHGQHPHVWQPPETYQGKPIFYSLGNFIFDQNWSAATSQSQAVRLLVTSKEIKDIAYFPYTIKYNSQPVFNRQ